MARCAHKGKTGTLTNLQCKHVLSDLFSVGVTRDGTRIVWCTSVDSEELKKCLN